MTGTLRYVTYSLSPDILFLLINVTHEKIQLNQCKLRCARKYCGDSRVLFSRLWLVTTPMGKSFPRVTIFYRYHSTGAAVKSNDLTISSFGNYPHTATYVTCRREYNVLSEIVQCFCRRQRQSSHVRNLELYAIFDYSLFLYAISTRIH